MGNPGKFTPFQRIWSLITIEKRNVRFLYVYAILSGAIGLVIPLGIQAIIGLVLAGRLSSSWFILILLITLAILISGLTRLAQISILENIQRKLFVRVAFDFSKKLAGSSTILKKYPSLVELSEKFLDVITVQKSFSKLLVDFTASVLQIIFGLVLLGVYHPAFLIFGMGLALMVITALRLTWKRGIESARRESDYKFKTAYWLTEIAQNKVTFNLKSEQQYHMKRADEYLSGYVQSRIDHFRILYRQAGIAITMKVTLTLTMLLLGSYLLVDEHISLGQFLASEILILTMVDAVEKLITSVENIYDSGIALEKLGSVMDAEMDAPHAIARNTRGDFTHAPSVTILSRSTGKILVDIKQGEIIGISGLPGFGRTNILKSVIGEIETDYSAQINGIPVDNIAKEDLGGLCGLCLQGSNIFEGTLAQNIILARDADMDELSRLSKILNFHQFVSTLNGGFNHHFELNTGVPNNISRKIPLARALYKTPHLILIDDIWTAFTRDELSRTMDYIRSLESTVIIISNHVPVLEALDRCLFLDGNGITDLGKINKNNIPDNLSNVAWI